MSQNLPEESVELLLGEVGDRLAALESGLPAHLDAITVSSISKLPFKALCYREALIWRMAELGRSAFEAFQNGKLASAILLTRAAVETTAALWYLQAKLDVAVQSGSVGDIDDYLMKLLMGSRTDTDLLPEAIGVMKFVDRLDKDIDGFRHQYDRLSEFAHPNWAGTGLLYSKSDSANFTTDFGSNIRGGDSTRKIGLVNLSVALAAFDVSYGRVGDLMPAFVALCEDRWRLGESGNTTL